MNNIESKEQLWVSKEKLLTMVAEKISDLLKKENLSQKEIMDLIVLSIQYDDIKHWIENKKKDAIEDFDLEILSKIKNFLETNKANLTWIFVESLREFVSEMEQLNVQKNEEIVNVIRSIKQELDQVQKLDKRFIKRFAVPIWNKQIYFAEDVEKYFDIQSKDNGIRLVGYKDLPLMIDFSIKKQERINDFDLSEDSIEKTWSVDIDLLIRPKEWVNFYEDVNSLRKDVDKQIVYYSFKKNWKNYLGILSFRFDWTNVTDFKVITKEVENQFSNQELKEYADKVKEFKIVKESVNTIDGKEIGFTTELWNSLEKKYKDPNAFMGAVIFSEWEILKNYSNEFNIWRVDLTGWWTGDLWWLIVDKAKFDQLWLEKNFKKYYELIQKTGLSVYEVKKAVEDYLMYGDPDKLKNNDIKRYIDFLTDINRDNKITAYYEIFAENQINEFFNIILKEKGVNFVRNAIDRIIKLWGKPKTLDTAKFDKIYFWRGLTLLAQIPNWLSQFVLNENMTFKDVILYNQRLQEKFVRDFIETVLGPEKANEFFEKLDKKAGSLYQEFVKRYPQFKNNMNENNFKIAVKFAWANALYILQKHGNDIWGGNVNWKIRNKIINIIVDNISLGIVRDTNGNYIPGISLSKSIEKQLSNDLKWWLNVSLVNFVIPVVWISLWKDITNKEFTDWWESRKILNFGLSFAGPVSIWTVWIDKWISTTIERNYQNIRFFIEKLFDENWELKPIDISKLNWVEKTIYFMIKSIVWEEWLSKISPEWREKFIEEVSQIIWTVYRKIAYENNQWIHWAGWGLNIVFGILPLISKKYERIKVKYSESNKDLMKSTKLGVESRWIESKLKLEALKRYLLEYWLEYNWHNLVLNKDKLPKWTIIALGEGIDARKKGENIIIWGNLNKLEEYKILTWDGKELTIIELWKNGVVFNGDIPLVLNWVWKDTNWKIEDHINYVDNVSQITFPKEISYYTQTKENISNINIKNNLEEIEEKYRDLWNLIDESINANIWNGKVNWRELGNFLRKYYKELVNKYRNLDYNWVLNVIEKELLRKWSPFSFYIYFRFKEKTHSNLEAQKKIDKLREQIDNLINVGSVLEKQLFIEHFFDSLFKEENLKYKQWKEKYEVIKNKIEKFKQKYWIIEKDWWYFIKDKMFVKWETGKYELIDKKWTHKIAQIWQELFMEKLFLDIWDKNAAQVFHERYFARMSMADYDSKDLLVSKQLDTNFNRTAWWLNAIRNSIFSPEDLKRIEKSQEGQVKNLILWEDWKGIKSEKDINRLVDFYNQLESNQKPEWFKNLDPALKEKVKEFVYLAYEKNKYLEKPEMSKPYYRVNRIENKQILAYPYTFRPWVEWEEWAVPMVGYLKFVDLNWDWNFNKEDYIILDKNKINNVIEYLWKITPKVFKDSLKKILVNNGISEINDKDLKKLWKGEKVKFWNKNVKLDYKLALAKWWTCFNDWFVILNPKLIIKEEVKAKKIEEWEVVKETKLIVSSNGFEVESNTFGLIFGYRELEKPKKEEKNKPHSEPGEDKKPISVNDNTSSSVVTNESWQTTTFQSETWFQPEKESSNLTNEPWQTTTFQSEIWFQP